MTGQKKLGLLQPNVKRLLLLHLGRSLIYDMSGVLSVSVTQHLHSNLFVTSGSQGSGNIEASDMHPPSMTRFISGAPVGRGQSSEGFLLGLDTACPCPALPLTACFDQIL